MYTSNESISVSSSLAIPNFQGSRADILNNLADTQKNRALPVVSQLKPPTKTLPSVLLIAFDQFYDY